MTTGQGASIVLTFGGMAAFDPTAEVDLAIDPAADNLTVDPAGDVLVVTAGIVWVGISASFVVPDGAGVIGIEAGGALLTEGGAPIGMDTGAPQHALGLEAGGLMLTQTGALIATET